MQTQTVNAVIVIAVRYESPVTAATARKTSTLIATLASSVSCAHGSATTPWP